MRKIRGGRGKPKTSVASVQTQTDEISVQSLHQNPSRKSTRNQRTRSTCKETMHVSEVVEVNDEGKNDVMASVSDGDSEHEIAARNIEESHHDDAEELKRKEAEEEQQLEKRKDSWMEVETAAGQLLFNCQHCGVSFANKSRLLRHIKVHDDVEVEKKNGPNKKGGRSKTTAKVKKRNGVPLCRHKNCQRTITMDMERKTVCVDCGANVELKYNARNLKETNKHWPCDFCSRVFTGKGAKMVHMSHMHPTNFSVEKNFICEVCGKCFASKKSLGKHTFLHKHKYNCDVCGLGLHNFRTLEAHMLIHTNEKPFSCKFCEKTYRQKGDLVKHERHHTGEKPYVCEVCNKAYRTSAARRNHLQSVHSGERKFKCEHCGKAYLTYGNYRSHVRMVHKPKEECKVCGKLVRSMVGHMRMHTNEKPYPCKICGERFALGGTLSRHMSYHRSGKDMTKKRGTTPKTKSKSKDKATEHQAENVPEVLPVAIFPAVTQESANHSDARSAEEYVVGQALVEVMQQTGVQPPWIVTSEFAHFPDNVSHTLEIE